MAKRVTKLEDYPVYTPEQEAKLIEKWLKKNKPSVQVEDNKKMPHLTPSGRIGQDDLW